MLKAIVRVCGVIEKSWVMGEKYGTKREMNGTEEAAV